MTVSSIIAASSGHNITTGSTSTQINDKPTVTKVWLDQKGHLGLYLGCCLILINVPGKTKVTQLTVQKPRQYPLLCFTLQSKAGQVEFYFQFSDLSVELDHSIGWSLIGREERKKVQSTAGQSCSTSA